MKRPKRKPCPACGVPFSRGVLVLRLVARKLQRWERVCRPCGSLAVPVLAEGVARSAQCETCRKAAARFCGACATAGAIAAGVARSYAKRPAVSP